MKKILFFALMIVALIFLNLTYAQLIPAIGLIGLAARGLIIALEVLVVMIFGPKLV